MDANFEAMGDGTVHLHCTDVAGEWLFTRRNGEITVTAEHAKGDVAARGTASDLLLFLWGRVPASELEIFGDAELLARFSAGMRV
jgi:predicted lipid carrier protein YhbT